MEQTIYSSLKFFLVSGVEAAAFLCVAVIALRRLGGGARGLLAILAGVLGLLSAGTYAAAWAQVEWRGSFSILDAVSSQAVLQHLDWARAIAVVLLSAVVISSLSREDSHAS